MRSFSVPRRRPHVVDFTTPFVYGVDTYRLKWAANFDAVPTPFLDSSNIGFLDPAVSQASLDVPPTRGKVRIVFDPTTYHIPDNAPFWLWFAQVTGGIETFVSPPGLILPDASRLGSGLITIAGTAPAAADLASALQIDLPRSVQDLRIFNVGPMYVAFDRGGPETLLLGDTQPMSFGIWGVQSTLIVRGSGGDIPFSASFTFANPR